MMDLLNNLVKEMNEALKVSCEDMKLSFPIDVIEGEGEYQVLASLPGFTKEEIEISFDDDTLKVSAAHKKEKNEDCKRKFLVKERSDAKYERNIYFGDINLDSISAKYENGILNVTLKEKAKEPKKQIVIE